jgi:UTP--glucose-1-phosphate uridylyltransferase
MNVLSSFKEKMQALRLPETTIRAFEKQYALLANGSDGYVPEKDILPVAAPDVISLDSLVQYEAQGKSALSRCGVLKLNGGLGTSMGLAGPKSLLPVKNGLSFLDIAIKQVNILGTATGFPVPLLLMNSFATHRQTLHALSTNHELAGNQAIQFEQTRFPRICEKTLVPIHCPLDPESEWAPPGHGELYTVLETSGTLQTLLDKDIEYLFVSNCDNLGAWLDQRLLGFFAESKSPFLMEVTRRTDMDRKGGHCARLPDGRFVLRESAQCRPNELTQFQDIEKHRYFNTNNLWINLRSVKEILKKYDGILPLPLIVNRKPAPMGSNCSGSMIQLESAMGAAISLFAEAKLVCVPRDRFAPVKRCDDLLPVRSNRFCLSSDFRIVPGAECRTGSIRIILDPKYFSRLADFESRFNQGVPDLLRCSSLEIAGDVRFGRNVAVEGNVRIRNEGPVQKVIPDNTVLARDCAL